MNIPAALLSLSLLFPAGLAAEEDGDASAELCEDLGKPFFSFSDLPAGGSAVTQGRRLGLPFSFLSPKPAGIYRVFVIGESAAALLGAEKEYERILARRLGKPRVELVNCGMGSYNSALIGPVLEEALELEPDLIVLLSGNNESIGRKICPGVLPELELRFNALRARVKSLSMPERKAAEAVSISAHEERLRGMAGAAAARGVPLVLCTLPANLRDHAPAGEPSPEVLRGIGLMGAGSHGAALKEFGAKGLENDPLALFYSGRALEALGRGAEARVRYEAALVNDPDDSRCSAARNAMLRRVAAEEGACLADLEAAFSRLAVGGITGGAELADGVHWFARYNSFVHDEIGSAASRCLSGPAARAAPPAAPGPGDKLKEFRLLFSYAAAELHAGEKTPSGGRKLLSERVIVNLERMRSLDGARLRRALLDGKDFGGDLLSSRWRPTLRRDSAAWRPVLLLNAAEMYARACDNAAAEELRKLAEAAGLEPGEAGLKKAHCR
jgi:tetratricopeptide (TPR) repeat protein